MPDEKGTDLLSVNCGRCGKRLKIQVTDLREKHTVECPECENMLPTPGNTYSRDVALPMRPRGRLPVGWHY
jgi:hypothetical protein